MKIYAAQINPIVGDISGNTAKIISHIQKATKAGADIAVFPELSVTGYAPEDLLFRKSFLDDEQAALKKIAATIKNLSIIIGANYRDKDGNLFNGAYHICKGKLELAAIKSDPPNYGVFDEKRYYKSSNLLKTIIIKGKKVGVLVCEDSWTGTKTLAYKKEKVDLIISTNASPYESGKIQIRQKMIGERAKAAGCDIAYINIVGGQDSVVFDGGSFMVNSRGKVTASIPQFVEAGEIFSKKAPKLLWEDELHKAILLGLKDYVSKNGFSKVLLGLSGGIDSALVAVIAAEALGSKNVRLVMLPTRFTSESSYEDAKSLCKTLGIKPETIDIEPAFRSFEKMLAKNFEGLKTNIAEENLQSRIRAVTLMAISNKHNELLLSTGNKSEIAVGYSTLYGDSCGAYNPLKDLYKTEVYALAKWRGIIPKTIITKAPTAELRANQKDQESLPPYEELDKILKLMIDDNKSIKDVIKKGHKAAIVEKVAKLLYGAEYKRFQSAPGPKLSKRAFSKDWRMPLTNKYFK